MEPLNIHLRNLIIAGVRGQKIWILIIPQLPLAFSNINKERFVEFAKFDSFEVCKSNGKMAIIEYSALLILVSCLVGGSSLRVISTSIQEQSDREFTTNDLNPMMELTNGYNQAFKAFNQGDKNATIESDYSKNKNIPEYMFDIYTHKIERMVFGNPFDNVRIYKSSFTGLV